MAAGESRTFRRLASWHALNRAEMTYDVRYWHKADISTRSINVRSPILPNQGADEPRFFIVEP